MFPSTKKDTPKSFGSSKSNIYLYILEKFELKTRPDKLRKFKKIIPQDYLEKHILARYMEHQDFFYLYFKRELLKKLRTLPVIDQDAVILANINIYGSDSKSDASSPNDSMEESQCVEELIRKVLIQKNKILKMNRIIK